MNRLIALIFLLLLAPASHAVVVCRVVTGGGLSFGVYEVFALTPQDSTMNLTVTCDRYGWPAGVSMVLRLGPGSNSSSVNSRRMMRAGLPTDHLPYGLYRDVGRSNVWGTTDGVDTMSRTLSIPNRDSRSTTFTIYGRIPAQQDISAGTYSDSVQATIVY